MSSSINSQTFTDFINNWNDGKSFLIYSIGILSPETNYLSPEKDANDDSKDFFQKIYFLDKFNKVFSNKKSSIVFYYTDWCTTCKKVKLT